MACRLFDNRGVESLLPGDSAVHRQTKQFDCSLRLIEIIAKLSKCSSVNGYTLRLYTTMAGHLPQIIPQCIAHCVCLHK